MAGLKGTHCVEAIRKGMCVTLPRSYGRGTFYIRTTGHTNIETL